MVTDCTASSVGGTSIGKYHKNRCSGDTFKALKVFLMTESKF